MNEPENPYARPPVPQHPSDQLDLRQPVTPAGQGARFANLIGTIELFDDPIVNY